jgi:hypothetical protein
MFGYVLINKPELKIREYETYRSYYCGLCHTIKRRYGGLSRIILNYDMTFLVMLLSDLYDEEDQVQDNRCIVHPVRKHCSRQNEITDYCADMSVLLSYYNCLDDWKDDKKIRKKAMANMLKKKCDKVKAEYPDKAEFVEKKLQELAAVEEANEPNMDKAARIFGEIMAKIFVYKEDMWKDDLYRIGFYLGKFIYLLDAYNDIEEDLKKGEYNPFTEMHNNPDFQKQALDLLLMMISECTEAFERLPLVENVEILRNILYSGVWVRFGGGQTNGSI